LKIRIRFIHKIYEDTKKYRKIRIKLAALKERDEPAGHIDVLFRSLDANLRGVLFSVRPEEKSGASGPMVVRRNGDITRRLSGNTFGDHYAINDMRILEDGITYAGVTDLGDNDKEGLVGFFPDDDTDFYGMLVEFNGMTDVLYIFKESTTQRANAIESIRKYARLYWIHYFAKKPTAFALLRGIPMASILCSCFHLITRKRTRK